MELRGENFTYFSPNHQQYTLTGINDLRSCQKLCDVTLNIGSKKIVAHRIVLAACSVYFRNMFTMDFAESRITEITIQDVDESAMEILIDFCYTSRIVINENNVASLLSAASYIQLEEIKEVCCECLKRRLNLSNYLEIYSLATTHYCPELLRITIKFIGNNFEKIMNSNEFLSLSANQLKNLLSSNELNVKSEELVFDFVIKWVEWKEVERRIYFYELLQCVNLSLLGSEILIKKVATNRWIISDNNCRKLINDAKYQLLQQQPDARGPRTRPQYSLQESLFVVGGWCNNEATSSVEMYSPDSGYWRFLAAMKKPRYGVGIAVINNEVYVVGGHDGNNILDSTEIYSVESNHWSMEGSLMTSGRTSIGVATLNGNLYAIGGQNQYKYLEYAERYDPGADKWCRIASMTTKRVGVAVVAHNNYIYAIGGSSEQLVLNTAERYDPRENKWSLITPMCFPRKHSGCTVIDSQIYIVGGSNDCTELASAEMYDERSMSWYPIPNMAAKRYGVSVVGLGGEIYAIGGSNGKNNLKTIEIYNKERREWRLCCAKTNYGRFGSAACIINNI